MAQAFTIPEVAAQNLTGIEQKLVAFIVWSAYFALEAEVVFTKRIGFWGFSKTFTVKMSDLRPLLVRLFGEPVVEMA